MKSFLSLSFGFFFGFSVVSLVIFCLIYLRNIKGRKKVFLEGGFHDIKINFVFDATFCNNGEYVWND